MKCFLCEERPALTDSSMNLCRLCAEMAFEAMLQEAKEYERKQERDAQEDGQRD